MPNQDIPNGDYVDDDGWYVLPGSKDHADFCPVLSHDVSELLTHLARALPFAAVTLLTKMGNTATARAPQHLRAVNGFLRIPESGGWEMCIREDNICGICVHAKSH